MTSGAQLRDQGQGAVISADAAVHRGYREHAEVAIAALIDKGMEFTTDEIRLLIPKGVRPHHPNLLPAILGSMAKNGHIRAVGFRKCTRPSRRAGWMRVWAGVP